MKCPKCGNVLDVSHREGVEIDRCPECRGIWLDRGELERIIAFSPSNHDDDPNLSEPKRERFWEHFLG